MLIPLISVAIAITLLPVVLATFGPRLDRPRAAPRRPPQPRLDRLGAVHRPAPLGRSDPSAGRPGRLVLAASTIQLGNPQAESLAQAGPARAALDHLAAVRASAPARCPPSTPWCAPASPRRPSLATLDGVRGVVVRPTGTATALPSSRSSRPRTATRPGPRHARAIRARRACLRSPSAAGPPRARTSSTASTATSRSSSA